MWRDKPRAQRNQCGETSHAHRAASVERQATPPAAQEAEMPAAHWQRSQCGETRQAHRGTSVERQAMLPSCTRGIDARRTEEPVWRDKPCSPAAQEASTPGAQRNQHTHHRSRERQAMRYVPPRHSTGTRTALASAPPPRPPMCRRATAALPHLGPLCESAPQRHCHTKAPYMQPRHGTGTHTALASAPPPRPPMCRRATALVSAPPPRHPMRRFSAVCHPMPVHIMQPCTTTPLLCGVPPYAGAYSAATTAPPLRCAPSSAAATSMNADGAPPALCAALARTIRP